MRVFVMGADSVFVQAIRETSRRHGLSGLTFKQIDTRQPGRSRADWVIVLNADDRVWAIDHFRLPPHRVVRLSSAAASGAAPDRLATAFARMAVIGVYRPSVSEIGVRLAKRFVAWARPRVEALLMEEEQRKAQRLSEARSEQGGNPVQKVAANEPVARFVALARSWTGSEGPK